MYRVQTSLPLPPLNGAPGRDRAIVATLLYFDLFSFPLRADELVRFAHAPGALHADGNGHLSSADLPRQTEWWDSRDAFWFLKGREELIERRAALAAVSDAKLRRAEKYAALLQLIPGVRFIGVTGSLAMESAIPTDDIDFLVIAARNRMWLTRALVLSALLAWGVKRPDDGGNDYPDLICANIFLSESDLHIPDHNLFIAHEICQMRPLLGASSYQTFMDANPWVCHYLPQWQPAPAAFQDRPAWRRVQRGFEAALNNPLGSRLDRELGRRQLHRIQAKHARGHNPNVKVSPTQLRFHARDLSDYILNTFDARWRELHLYP